VARDGDGDADRVGGGGVGVGLGDESSPPTTVAVGNGPSVIGRTVLMIKVTTTTMITTSPSAPMINPQRRDRRAPGPPGAAGDGPRGSSVVSGDQRVPSQ
jgi:hypothetical protein